MATKLENITSKLQAAVDKARDLPYAIELDILDNPGNASTMLSGTEMLDTQGKKVTGNIVNNGSISKTIDGLETKSATIPAGYTTGGTVSLDSTIDNTATSQADLIAQISQALEGKAAGGGTSGISTCTLTIKKGTSRGRVYKHEYTTYNGEFNTYFNDYTNPGGENEILPQGSTGEYTINDLVVGSTFMMYGSASIRRWEIEVDGMTYRQARSTFKAVIISDTTITLYDDD